MMGTIAGVVVGSAIADALFDDYNTSPEAAEAGDTAGAGDTGAADGDQVGDAGTGDAQDGSGFSDSAGGSDFAGGDFGGRGLRGWGLRRRVLIQTVPHLLSASWTSSCSA